jgi:hypothetical protein
MQASKANYIDSNDLTHHFSQIRDKLAYPSQHTFTLHARDK